MTYNVSLQAEFHVGVQGPQMLRKFWDYVDRKLKETESESLEYEEHGYPPLVSVKPLNSHMSEVDMVGLKGCFVFHVYDRDVAKYQPDNGISIVIHQNIPQLDFAEEFPKLMKEIGCEDWTCDILLWRIDTLIDNLSLLKTHRIEEPIVMQ